MQFLLEHYKNIIWAGILITVSIFSLIFVRITTQNYYKPVRMSPSDERAPVGGVLRNPNDETKIQSMSYFHIKNHSNREHKVTFVVYQHSLAEYAGGLFDIDAVYIRRSADDVEMVEDEIVTIPAGETLYINIDATAKDSSQAWTSRGGPFVRIVVLD